LPDGIRPRRARSTQPSPAFTAAGALRREQRVEQSEEHAMLSRRASPATRARAKRRPPEAATQATAATALVRVKRRTGRGSVHGRAAVRTRARHRTRPQARSRGAAAEPTSVAWAWAEGYRPAVQRQRSGKVRLRRPGRRPHPEASNGRETFVRCELRSAADAQRRGPEPRAHHDFSHAPEAPHGCARWNAEPRSAGAAER
jgi:hypothetical protein